MNDDMRYSREHAARVDAQIFSRMHIYAGKAVFVLEHVSNGEVEYSVTSKLPEDTAPVMVAVNGIRYNP